VIVSCNHHDETGVGGILNRLEKKCFKVFVHSRQGEVHDRRIVGHRNPQCSGINLLKCDGLTVSVRTIIRWNIQPEREDQCVECYANGRGAVSTGRCRSGDIGSVSSAIKKLRAAPQKQILTGGMNSAGELIQLGINPTVEHGDRYAFSGRSGIPSRDRA
jgi:hypothetical protein